MLWLGGLLALDVTTSTPDAWCPPLEEARATVQARVGEVRGDYHAEYALVRAADGHRALELVVRDGERHEVLRREISLDATGCQDAAQAIALVLERFFDAIERPDEDRDQVKLEPVPDGSQLSASRPAPSTAQVAAPAVRPAPTVVAPQPRSLPIWRVRAGVEWDRELGIAPLFGVQLFPQRLRLSHGLQIGVGLEVAPFVTSKSQVVREEKASAFSLQTALSLPFGLSLEKWSAWVGPWAQLRFQQAQAPSLDHASSQYRVVPGFGGFGRLGWVLSPDLTLSAGLAVGVQPLFMTSRFVLRRADDSPEAVLVPETWFGQTELALTLAL